MTDTTFDFFDMWYDDQEDDSKPFAFAIRDTESPDERWVLTSLSEADAKTLADYIYGRLEK